MLFEETLANSVQLLRKISAHHRRDSNGDRHRSTHAGDSDPPQHNLFGKRNYSAISLGHGRGSVVRVRGRSVRPTPGGPAFVLKATESYAGFGTRQGNDG